MDEAVFVKEVQAGMAKAVEFLNQEFSGIRTGKASPSLVEGIDIKVASYGSSMKLKQLAMISTPEPRLIMVQPFDPSTTNEIAKGLGESKLGINPSVDGKVIRLPVPELSEERRKDMVKMCKEKCEESRVRVRAQRKDGIDAIKAAQKGGEITEDDQRRLEKEVQNFTDAAVKEIDSHFAAKEKEIMTV